MKGMALCVGLNHVDPAGYAGWEGRLSGCLNDAAAMTNIMNHQGFATVDFLVDEHARSNKVLQAIDDAARTLLPGDLFVFTYSGHGGQIDDPWGVYGQVDTICLFDRQVVSHELYMLWSAFRPGVRVVMVADSCHSGTVSRSIWEVVTKAIPRTVQIATQAQNHYLYKAIMRGMPNQQPATGVLLLGGCQDNQLSGDGLQNGLFTANLLNVYNNGAFAGDYRQFYEAYTVPMPVYQKPSYFYQGPDVPGFLTGRPFTI